MPSSPALHRIRESEAWIVVVASGAGLASAYWDDSWHTTLGRDSALIPPHLLLYVSIVSVGVVLAVWALRVLASTRSVLAVLRAPGFLLAVAAAAATAAAAPADAFWHAAFGRDAVLWSPPHLLSVIATTVLLAALLIGLDGHRSRALRVGLSAALLGATQIVVMEYDTDVPQFSETLYLPLLLLTGLGTGWVIVRMAGFRFAVSLAVLSYVVFRIIILIVLAIPGWIAPDVPLALLGLLLLNLPRPVSRWRWPLAILAVSLLQLIASFTGVSSVDIASVLQASIVVAGIILVILLATLVRHPIARAGVAVLIALSAVVGTPTPVFAHDPGQGPSFGTATMTVSGNGLGETTVSIAKVETAQSVDLHPERVIARRAGQTVSGPLTQSPEVAGGFAGSIELPSPGLWFIYAEFTDGTQSLEIWLPVQQDLDATVSEQRSLYEPVGAEGPKPLIEYVTGALLLAVGAALLGWVIVAVRRRGRAVGTAAAVQRFFTEPPR